MCGILVSDDMSMQTLQKHEQREIDQDLQCSVIFLPLEIPPSLLNLLAAEFQRVVHNGTRRNTNCHFYGTVKKRRTQRGSRVIILPCAVLQKYSDVRDAYSDVSSSR